jgi:diguanylate cyclase (GGDEF)-like protein
MVFEGRPIRITASIGVATHHEPNSFQSAQELLKTADDYLYSAKTSGRDRVHSRALKDTLDPAEPLI